MKTLQHIQTEVTNVYTTKDYFMFSSIEGNRNKNLLHINRLKKSIQNNYLFTVIIVNENYEIIDGQHRYEVIKELGLPLNYIICKGYGLREVQILNQNMKKWNADDYLTGYCNLGYYDYIAYSEFKKKYNIGHYECMNILAGVSSKNNYLNFTEGKFKIKSLKNSEHLMQNIMMIEPYYNGIRRGEFISTMIQLSQNKNFVFTEFVQKLKLQPTALVDCTTVEGYKLLIEEIYNYRRSKKINLRY